MSAIPSLAVPAATRPAERLAADQRVREFPYRFPAERRSLGGQWTVDQNQDFLLRCFYFERRLGQALGSWTLGIPEFEVKLETGRHIFWHYDAARTLRERLTELETSAEKIDDYRNADIDRIVEEACSAADAPELLAGIHLVIGRALTIAYRHRCDTTCAIADAPTIRALQRILLDYAPMLEWAEAAVQAYVDGGIDGSRLIAWRTHLARALATIGGIGGDTERAPAIALRIDTKPYVRGTMPMRDSRFATFTNTGDYYDADGVPERYAKDSWDARRMDFLRTQRDEVDAIEAFGTTLWDVRFKGFQAEYDLARITWDESRHTEIGHQALAASGYNPYELPNRLTSSTCRGPMDPLPAFAEINLFGEVAVIKNITNWCSEAKAHCDHIVVHAMDYVRADERTHVRKGRGVIKTMTDLGGKEIELITRKAFTACLLTLGAVTKPEDGGEAFILSREQIEHLVGE